MLQGNGTMEHLFGGWKIPLLFNPLILLTATLGDIEGVLKIVAIIVTIIAGIINIAIMLRKWKRGK
jgi:hypothetical protein